MSGPAEKPLLLALDLDGTLVEPRRPVRAAVVDAVRRAAGAGVRATIVTGRMYVGAKPYAEILEIDGPIVCYQGAVTADARTGRFEREVPLANAVALRVYEAAKRRDLHVQFYRDDRFYVERDDRWARLYAQTSKTEPVVVASLPDAFAGRDSTKVVIVTDADRAAEVETLMREVCGADAYVTRSNPEFVEMLSPLVDKGVALRLLAAELGVPLDRIMAVGDSWNDLPFLEVAGFAVAMGSAPDELKARADAVVGDVEHDGVAEAVERFILGRS